MAGRRLTRHEFSIRENARDAGGAGLNPLTNQASHASHACRMERGPLSLVETARALFIFRGLCGTSATHTQFLFT